MLPGFPFFKFNNSMTLPKPTVTPAPDPRFCLKVLSGKNSRLVQEYFKL